MPTKRNWFSRKWRALLYVAGLLLTLLVAVMGWHWTETAKTAFWSDFWVGAAIVSLIGFAGLIHWFNQSRKKW